VDPNTDKKAQLAISDACRIWGLFAKKPYLRKRRTAVSDQFGWSIESGGVVQCGFGGGLAEGVGTDM